MMKKMWIGGTHYGNRGVSSESWQGGGMSDAAWKQRYADGYLFVHSCGDTLGDDDVIHYIFQKVECTEPLRACEMCGYEFTCKEDYGKLDVQVPPGTKAFFEEHRAKLPEWTK